MLIWGTLAKYWPCHFNLLLMTFKYILLQACLYQLGKLSKGYHLKITNSIYVLFFDILNSDVYLVLAVLRETCRISWGSFFSILGNQISVCNPFMWSYFQKMLHVSG